MDADTLALFETMRSDAGFSARDNSEFLAAKPWYGHSFTLPALDPLRLIQGEPPKGP
ncbi:hypothetical protein GPK29_22450 [Aeromonas hydrophila]|uniref:hypothetical protein n=1 Tax=Aeromonas hydrophila TaxID=644 RepID=UPI001C5A8CA4|nr:hypothetical protein [Aeromonas hydrophila]MBW3798957.1 hypothetical protein [Aeromonas hydrophila]MBW3803750.1 hypothetical protein [Aeromonas hydrophila]MBW3821939.1 hypothetical protein [Aeromonas hydrophila]